ncbi:hypothetical protein DL96DRAFT_944407 [Flagelloscypha sp. PMI_526]|nr:hypothetical protein DL96DRAFT_944407 [Flagelloscypha sp. PMI_526]
MSSINRHARSAEEYDSDNLDEPARPSPPKKQKMTKAQEAKAKAAAKKKKEAEERDEEDDAYTALSKSAFNGPSKPPNGSMIDCVKCEQKFTVTRYTLAAIPGPGWLCHVCAKASGADPFKKPAAPRKRKPATEKRTVVHYEEKRFPSLISLCVQVVSKHIDEVEALGDLGTLNLQEIAKAIAKNRSLTSENVQLFYNASQVSLTLFDATNLLPAAYDTLALLNPCLTSLRLDYCGQINSSSLDSLANNLPNLREIELLGPFLVRTDAWQHFLHSKKLTSFKITQSPRFDLACLDSLLCTSGDTLQELRLCEVGQLDDTFIRALIGSDPESEETKGKKKRGRGRPSAVGACEPSTSPFLPCLRYLDLSHPSEACSQDALLELIYNLGVNLEHLDLRGHDTIMDEFFTRGILSCCSHLRTLIMASVSEELTDAGIAAFFSSWQNPPLTHIDLSRNPSLASSALTALLDHSGATLEYLNINGWKNVSHDTATSVAVKARELRRLDMGWCREVDDFVLKALIMGNEDEHRSGLPFLKEIWVWGCGRVNGMFPRKKGVLVHGLEGHRL